MKKQTNLNGGRNPAIFYLVKPARALILNGESWVEAFEFGAGVVFEQSINAISVVASGRNNRGHLSSFRPAAKSLGMDAKLFPGDR